MAWIKATDNDFKKNPKWEYMKDKIIEGIIVKKNLDVTVKKLCFYDIEVSGKGTYSVLGNVVTNRILRDLPIGTLVKIQFLGVAKAKNGSEFNNFDVFYNQESTDIAAEAEKIFGSK